LDGVAEAHYQLGSFTRAEEILLRVFDNWPEQNQVYPYLLQLYLRWVQQDSLSDLFCQSLSRRANGIVKRWLTLDHDSDMPLFRNPGLPDVIGILEDLSLNYPDSFEVGLPLCQLYVAADRQADALRTIEHMRQIHPQNNKVLTRAAMIHERYSRFDLAARERLQLWQSDRQNLQLFLSALQTLRQAGQSYQALRIFNDAAVQSIWPDRLKVIKTLQVELLNLFMITRHYSQAVELFENWYWVCLSPYHDYLSALDNQPTENMTEVRHICLKNLIWALTQARYYDRAIVHSLVLYKDHPSEDNLFLLWLSRTLNIRQLHHQSLRLLRQILVLNPDDFALRMQFYITLVEQGHADRAIQLAQEKLQQAPQNTKPRSQMIFLYQRLARYDQAVVFVQELLRDDPQNEDLRLRLAHFLIQDRQFSQARDLLAELEKNQDIYPQWLDAQVKFELAQDNPEKIVEKLENLTGNAPSLPVRKIIVQILEMAGQYEIALQRQQKIIDENPDDTDAKLQFCIILDKMDRTDQAIEILEDILQKHPRNPGIKNNLAYNLIENHDQTARAYRLLRDSLAVDPDSAATLDSMGWFFYKCGKFDQALQYVYQSAANLPAPDKEILNHLGDIAYRLGQTDQARVFWQRVLEFIEINMITQKNLESDADCIRRKIKQLDQGRPVEVAPLFDPIPIIDESEN